MIRALAIAVVCAAAVPAHADDKDDKDDKVKIADRLFAEGKALMDVNLAEACAKFDESYRYNPAALGTLLNVGLCDEKLGKLASAYARFTQARDLAKEQNLTHHQEAAEEHLAALEGKVPHVTIKLAEQLPGTKVVIDNQLVAQADNVPVDPGERAIVVSAPERLPYETKIVIKPGEHQDVAVPALAKSITVKSSRRRIGQITVIAGSAAAVTGLGVALYARHLYNDQFDGGACVHRSDGDFCTSSGQRNTERARTLGVVATVIGSVGLAAAGVGTYLWLRAPHDSETQVSLVPQIGPDGAGLAAVGRF